MEGKCSRWLRWECTRHPWGPLGSFVPTRRADICGATRRAVEYSFDFPFTAMPALPLGRANDRPKRAPRVRACLIRRARLHSRARTPPAARPVRWRVLARLQKERPIARLRRDLPTLDVRARAADIFTLFRSIALLAVVLDGCTGAIPCAMARTNAC